MRLLADENLLFVEAFFGDLAEIQRLPAHKITPQALKGIEALLVRSVTPVNAKLLARTPVRFVGSATIGVDHVDQPWLQEAGIAFAHAPGCNADAVGDYVLSSLLVWAQAQGVLLRDQVIGLVGVGQVGGRLARRLAAYGCSLRLNDPPREAAGDEGAWVDLETLLQTSDLVCLHTPLTVSGSYPTRGLLGKQALEWLAGKCLLNAGRGAVIQQAALQDIQRLGVPLTLILDVFAQEPAVDRALVAQAWQATPHIAGHSLEGKARATEQLYQAFCAHLGSAPTKSLAAFLPAPLLPPLHLCPEASPEAACRQAALAVYDPRKDAARFREALAGQEAAEAFTRLRKNYPIRREFSSFPVRPADAVQAQALKALGFSLAEH